LLVVGKNDLVHGAPVGHVPWHDPVQMEWSVDRRLCVDHIVSSGVFVRSDLVSLVGDDDRWAVSGASVRTA
jgi:hypothetical protein